MNNGHDGQSGPHIHLRSWRKAHGLTLEQLANRIGSKISTISGWETGSRDMDLADLEKIARAYGVHPAILLFAPPGSQKFHDLREVNDLWEKMSADVFSDWLRAGKRMIHEPQGEP